MGFFCVVWRMDVRSLGQIGTKLRLTAIFYRKNLQMRIFFRNFVGELKLLSAIGSQQLAISSQQLAISRQQSGVR
jgi:hypothetical protein